MVMVKKKKNLVGKVIYEADKPCGGFVMKEFEDFIVFGRRAVEKK